MTVPATTRRAGPFNGNGVTTSFPFAFKVFAAADVEVTLVGVDGISSVLVLDSDYTVALNSDQDAAPGGSISYSTLATGETLTAIGSLDYDQVLDLPGGGAFSPRAVENALDRSTIQIQQLAEELDRALTLPPSATADATLPVPEAGKVIAWNSTATGLVNLDSADLASVVVAGSAYTDIFSGNAVQIAFTLTSDPGGVNALDVAIGGVSQVNGVDFTVSGKTLTFTSAPPAGTGNTVVRYVAAVPVGTTTAADTQYAYTGVATSGTAAAAIDALQAATRSVIKALDTTKHKGAYLTEPGRQGSFGWVLGDFATRVAADTTEGVYLKADAISASTGAWVRATPGDGEWHADWFGAPNDPAAGGGGGSQVTAHAELSAMINLGNIVKPSIIRLGSKIYTLTAALPQISWQVTVEGSRGFQGTIICKRYVEASATRGILAFNDFGFSLRDLQIRATSGSGGAGISAILTLNSPAAGRTYLERCYVSTGDFCNYSLYVDGTTNTTGSGPSYRGIWIVGGEYFGAASGSIRLGSVHHVFVSGTFGATSGGSSSIVLQLDGNATSYNDDVQWHGMLAGRVNINWLSRGQFVTPMTDNWVVDVNTTKTSRVGHRSAGALTNNAAAGEYVDEYDGTVVASGGTSTAGWRKWGSGRIQQWGTVTTVGGVLAGTAWPLAFTSSNINCHANVQADQGANIIGGAQIVPVAGNTNYDVKAFVFNYSTGAYGGASAVVRWAADGA